MKIFKYLFGYKFYKILLLGNNFPMILNSTYHLTINLSLSALNEASFLLNILASSITAPSKFFK